MKKGKLVKSNRIKRGLTQEELSKGIISVSYLSKIENEQVCPSEEVFTLLLNRLGIDTSCYDLDSNDSLLERVVIYGLMH